MALKTFGGKSASSSPEARQRLDPFITKVLVTERAFVEALQAAKSAANGLDLPKHKNKLTEILAMGNRIQTLLLEIRGPL